jgi:hypothetical protein
MPKLKKSFLILLKCRMLLQTILIKIEYEKYQLRFIREKF